MADDLEYQKAMQKITDDAYKAAKKWNVRKIVSVIAANEEAILNTPGDDETAAALEGLRKALREKSHGRGRI